MLTQAFNTMPCRPRPQCVNAVRQSKHGQHLTHFRYKHATTSPHYNPATTFATFASKIKPCPFDLAVTLTCPGGSSWTSEAGSLIQNWTKMLGIFGSFIKQCASHGQMNLGHHQLCTLVQCILDISWSLISKILRERVSCEVSLGSLKFWPTLCCCCLAKSNNVILVLHRNISGVWKTRPVTRILF